MMLRCASFPWVTCSLAIRKCVTKKSYRIRQFIFDVMFVLSIPKTDQEQEQCTMPSYIFRLEQFHIDNTRAADDDTDVVSFAMKVGDQALGEPQIKHMGNVDNGDHAVNLQFGPISVDTPATPVVFNYQILNSGH